MDKQDLQRELEVYYHEIKSKIICKKELKKEFFSEFQLSVESFIEEENPSSMEEIQMHFGSPEEIAQEFLASLDDKDIRKALNWRKIIFIAVIIILSMIMIYLLASFLDGHRHAEGYGAVNMAITTIVTMLQGGE